jgi:ankyrin repeat protein
LKFFFLPFVAKSVVRVCRQWNYLCIDELKPQQLHINGIDAYLFKSAVRNFKVSTLIVHNASLQQIAQLLVCSREPILTVVAYGAYGSNVVMTQEEMTKLETVKTLALHTTQLRFLDAFTKVTRLQLLHNSTFPEINRSYFDVVELAVDKDCLIRNFDAILKLFPSLKTIQVMNDPTEDARTALKQLAERGIQLEWPLHIRVEQLAHVPYHHFYYQAGDTMAVKKLSYVMYNWPSTSTSLEYEKDLYSRPLEYVYPSAIDYLKQPQIRLTEPQIIKKIVKQARSTSQTLKFITKTSILPYWKIVDLCLEYSNKALLLDVLRRLEDRHLLNIKPRVICQLIEFFGLPGFINTVGSDVFHLVANSQNFKGNALAHKLVGENCRVDLNNIDSFITNWNVVNYEGVAPIDVAVQTLDLSVIMFLLQRGAKLSSTHNIPFQYKYFPFWIRYLPDAFLTKNATEMLFHEDWLRSGSSVIKALDTMVEVGADVHAFNWRHQSFLNFIISFYGYYPEKLDLCNLIQRLVINYHVDINHLDGTGDTPLGTAIKTSNMKIIKLILQLGANVDDVCSNNMKPIPFICSTINNINEFKCLINCLIEFGADVNATSLQFSEKEDREISPLLLIMEKPRSTPFIKHLVACGAKLDYVDSFGSTLLLHFLHKTSDVDLFNQAAQLLQQKLVVDNMEIEGAQYITFLPSQISPEISEEILAILFGNNIETIL